MGLEAFCYIRIPSTEEKDWCGFCSFCYIRIPPAEFKRQGIGNSNQVTAKSSQLFSRHALLVTLVITITIIIKNHRSDKKADNSHQVTALNLKFNLKNLSLN